MEHVEPDFLWFLVIIVYSKKIFYYVQFNLDEIIFRQILENAVE